MRTRFACLALAGLALVARPVDAQDNLFADCGTNDTVRSNGKQTTEIPGRPGATRLMLTGDVVFPCGDMTLWADEVVYETDTRLIHATGNVLFQQADLHLSAARAEIDARTKFGTFYDAWGSARLGNDPAEKSLFGTRDTDVLFVGKRVEKVGPDSYRISDGRFTTCMQATPRWQMSGSSGTITLDKYALLKNVVLKVKGVPLLYLPAIYYPINKEGRSTGFLLPTYGASTALGPTFSNAFFLVLGRSQDATFYHDWFSKGGQGLGTEYRYASAPGSEGRANVVLINTPERLSGGTTIAARRAYRIDGSANQLLPRGFRLFGNINLFTDAATQQLFQDVNDFSRRDQSFSGTLTGAIGRYRLLALAEQRDTFFGSTTAQRSGRAPFASLTIGQTPLGRSRVYVGGWAEGGRVVRQNDIDDAATNRTLWRFDASPTLRAPLSTLPYLSATGSVSWRLTQWSESLDPLTGDQVSVPVTRQLVEMSADVRGPVLARVFQTPGNSYAERFKHLIEPSLRIRFMTPFDGFNRVANNDPGVDAIVGGDVQVAYGLANRLIARRTGATIREILSVNVNQTYYTDALAARYDPQYQSNNSSPQAPVSRFSPLRIEATTRPVDSASANFRMEIDSTYRAVRQLDANATLHATRVQLNAGWSKRNFILGLPGFDAGGANHSLNAGTTIRTRDNRLGGSYQFNYDVRRSVLLQQRILAYYNSQCCGVAFDWQSRSSPLLGLASNHNWTVSFTLAGIGTFSNPLGSLGGR